MTEYNEKQCARIAGYLGIAQKAGLIIAGDNMVKDALLKGKVEMLVIAADAAETVRDELRTLADAQEIPVLEWPNKIDLGLIVGKSHRGALAVTDKGFANAICKVKESE